jgi:hypothetical protein
MLQKQFYSRMSYRLAIFPSMKSHEQLAPLDTKGRHMRWIYPVATGEMRVGDILTSGLALYRADMREATYKSFPHGTLRQELCSESEWLEFSFLITSQFLARWHDILSKFPDEQRENPPEISRDRFTPSIPPFGENNKPVLLLICLEEFRHVPKLDCERDFWEGKSLFTQDIAPQFEARGFFETYKPVWRFWKYWKVSFLATVFSTIFGGVHLVAWTWVFPTREEEILWKLSCFVIIGALPCYFVISSFVWFSTLLNSRVLDLARKAPESLKKSMKKMAKFFCVCLLWVLGIVYILSRLFIVAEAFASLRYCPVGVFVTFQWLQLFPHF